MGMPVFPTLQQHFRLDKVAMLWYNYIVLRYGCALSTAPCSL